MTPAEFNEFTKLKAERIKLLEQSAAIAEAGSVKGDKEAMTAMHRIWRRLKTVGARLSQLSGKSQYAG
jgi:hypothetical protein